MAKQESITKQLNSLSNIADWFENQEEIDVEEGLKKAKEAAKIIKASRKRLQEVENEFVEIKKEISEDIKD